MAVDPTFVDTNVLVYASQKRSAFHARAVSCLQEARAGRRALWISRQVLREYLAAVTRPQHNQAPLPMAEAIADIERFERDFNVAEDGQEVFAELLRLLARVPVAGKQVHDANLAATMLTHGMTCLLTFNDADFRRFGSVIEIVAP